MLLVNRPVLKPPSRIFLTAVIMSGNGVVNSGFVTMSWTISPWISLPRIFRARSFSLDGNSAAVIKPHSNCPNKPEKNINDHKCSYKIVLKKGWERYIIYNIESCILSNFKTSKLLLLSINWSENIVANVFIYGIIWFRFCW